MDAAGRKIEILKLGSLAAVFAQEQDALVGEGPTGPGGWVQKGNLCFCSSIHRHLPDFWILITRLGVVERLSIHRFICREAALPSDLERLTALGGHSPDLIA